jgi:hypothetical protein
VYFHIPSLTLLEQGEFTHSETQFNIIENKYIWGGWGVSDLFERWEDFRVCIEGGWMVVGDTWGRLRIFRYPANIKEIGSVSIRVLGGPIDGIRVVEDGKVLLVLCGGNIWRY